MRRYWLPNYEKKLIGELQRQQNSAQFCDTLLQTEGISIPTHSSVLAGLSLHLSQRLLACPSPPSGQKRRLQLHTLKPQTLIKLVGLLYSGELEVNGASEQRDVLAAAHLFGLPDLIEGEKTDRICRGKRDGCTEKDSRRGEIVKRDAQIQVVPRSFCSSIGTQTVIEDTDRTVENYQQDAHSSSLPHSCNIAETIPSDTLTSTTCPAICRTFRQYSDGESTLDQSSDCMTSATSSLLFQSENMTLHLSASEDSNFSGLQEGDVQQSLCETSVGFASNSPVIEEDGISKVSENRETTIQDNRRGPVGVEKRLGNTNVASKNLEKMQEVMEATQISIKVKLRRRRTKEEMWEVVNMQDANNTLSVVTSLRQDASTYKRPQGELTPVQPSPSTTHVCHTQASVLQPATSSPKPVPHSSRAICQSVPTDSDLVPVPLQPPRPVEETDEQIEKLLEDIMIGLNILPNVDKDSNKSQHLDPSHDGGPCQAPEDKGSYCTCCQDYETIGHSSTDTALSVPGCTGLTPAESCDANDALIPTQHNSSAGHTRRHGPQCSLLQKASRSAEPCLSGEQQKLPANQKSSSQGDPNVLNFLPLVNENETHLFSMADLQFLPCLSPLDSNNNNLTGTSNKTLGQSSLPRRTWLMDNPGSLEFPLSAVAQKLRSSPSVCKEKTSHGEIVPSPGNSQPVKVLRKINRHFAKDVLPRERKKKCPNLKLNQTDRDVKVRTDTKIKLSPCSVSLSSNNVLAKERQQSITTPPNVAGEPNSRSTTTTTSISLRVKARSSGETSKKPPTRTRGKAQQTPGHTTSEMSSPNPSPSQTEIEQKSKRGRPRKKTQIYCTSPVVERNSQIEESEHQNKNPSLEESEEAKSKMRKRRRHEDVEESPIKQVIHSNNSYDAHPDDNNNTTPAEKRPRLVSLKEFQELIKRQHLKTRRIKEKCENEQSKNAKNNDAPVTDLIQEKETANSHSEEVDMTEDIDEQGQNTATQLLNQSANAQGTLQADNSCRSVSEKTNSSGNDGQSVFCTGALAKEVTKLSGEKEEVKKALLETSHEGATHTADESEVNIDEDLSLLATRQEKMSADNSLNSLTLKKCDIGDFKEARSSDRSSGCQQEDDEEVDVLLHSPDRTSVTSECNKSVAISPDEEEEEEDSNDVDVTGDETDVCIDA